MKKCKCKSGCKLRRFIGRLVGVAVVANVALFAVFFFDLDGKLLYASAITTYNVGLPAGQTMELKETISSDFVELWDKNGTAPATVKTIGFQN